jgi:hypothetical protein
VVASRNHAPRRRALIPYPQGKADLSMFRLQTVSGGSSRVLITPHAAQRSTAGILIQQFGQAGDKPTPAAFIP